MSNIIQGPSSIIVPSSKAPPVIPRTPSSTVPHPNPHTPMVSATSATFSVGASTPNRQNSLPLNNSKLSATYINQQPLGSTQQPQAQQLYNANIPPTKSIYEKNLNRRTPDVSLSSFAFIFSEAIQYLQKQSNGIQDLEAK